MKGQLTLPSLAELAEQLITPAVQLWWLIVHELKLQGVLGEPSEFLAYLFPLAVWCSLE